MNMIDKEKAKNLSDGLPFRLEDIPIKKFYDQAQYIDQELLPKIARQRGEDSADLKFFHEVYKSLLYAIMVVDREKNIVSKLQKEMQLRRILQDRLNFAEKELTKYATVEDLYLTSAMDHIERGVIQRAKDLLNKK